MKSSELPRTGATIRLYPPSIDLWSVLSGASCFSEDRSPFVRQCFHISRICLFMFNLLLHLVDQQEREESINRRIAMGAVFSNPVRKHKKKRKVPPVEEQSKKQSKDKKRRKETDDIVSMDSWQVPASSEYRRFPDRCLSFCASPSKRRRADLHNVPAMDFGRVEADEFQHGERRKAYNEAIASGVNYGDVEFSPSYEDYVSSVDEAMKDLQLTIKNHVEVLDGSGYGDEAIEDTAYEFCTCADAYYTAKVLQCPCWNGLFVCCDTLEFVAYEHRKYGYFKGMERVSQAKKILDKAVLEPSTNVVHALEQVSNYIPPEFDFPMHVLTRHKAAMHFLTDEEFPSKHPHNPMLPKNHPECYTVDPLKNAEIVVMNNNNPQAVAEIHGKSVLASHPWGAILFAMDEWVPEEFMNPLCIGEIVGYFRMLAFHRQDLQDLPSTKRLRLFPPVEELMNPYTQRVYVKTTILTLNGRPCCWSDLSALYQKRQEEQRWEWIKLGPSAPITKLPKIIFMAPHERPYQIRERDLSLWKDEQSQEHPKRDPSALEQLPIPVMVHIMSFLCTRATGRLSVAGYERSATGGFRSDVFAYFEANPRHHHTLLRNPVFHSICTRNFYQWKRETRYYRPSSDSNEDSDSE